MTTALAEIQSFFAAAIQKPVPVADQNAVLPLVALDIAGNAKMTPVEQLDVYREQFFMRHIDALREDFVTVHQLLGCDAFDKLCEAYLAKHPPAAFSLRDLGAHFTAFLATTAPYADDPLLADCARLEWAFVDAFDAGDAAPIDASAIAQVPEDAWDRAKLAFHPSVQPAALAYPAHVYRAKVRADEAAERPTAAPSYVVVFRGQDNLMFVPLEKLAFDLLVRLRAGQALGAACEALAKEPGAEAELGEKVGGWFQAWTQWGWISAIEV